MTTALDTAIPIVQTPPMKKTRKYVNLDDDNFKKYVKEASYPNLVKLRKELLANEELKNRLQRTEKRMREILDSGYVVKKRMQGTGSRIEQEKEYKDTPSNRALGRVGLTYKSVRFENPDYHFIAPKLRRKRKVRSEEEKKNAKTNLWIASVGQAKLELDAPKWVVIRREALDSGAADDIGVRVYKRAMEIMNEKKEALK
jgi:hypothetical protein